MVKSYPVNYDNTGMSAYPEQMMPMNYSYGQAPIPNAGPAPGDIMNAILAVQRNPDEFSKDEIERARQYSLE